jgi:hypothetical protein
MLPFPCGSGESHVHPLDHMAFAGGDLEQDVLAVPPKPDVEALSPQPQVGQRHVGPRGIDMELAARRVLLKPQHRFPSTSPLFWSPPNDRSPGPISMRVPSMDCHHRAVVVVKHDHHARSHDRGHRGHMGRD